MCGQIDRREGSAANDKMGSLADQNGRHDMVSNDYYTEAIHGPHEYFDLGDFPLETGYTLRRPSQGSLALAHFR